jgi:hypothetical protein
MDANIPARQMPTSISTKEKPFSLTETGVVWNVLWSLQATLTIAKVQSFFMMLQTLQRLEQKSLIKK